MRKLLMAAFVFLTIAIYAQETVTETFDDTRVVNGHSVETNKEGSMKFIIAHRFGVLNGGAYELFGLDQSRIRLGFDYGITDNFTIGAGRSSHHKTIDGFVKARILSQQKGSGSPVTLTWLSTSDYKTLKTAFGEEIDATLRFSFTHQLLIAKKFGDRLSVQIMPTYLHRNLVETRDALNDLFAVGTAGRLRLTQMLSLKGEYYFTFSESEGQFRNPSLDRTNSLAIGVDIETKHHVFQLHIGNSQGMTEKFFISESTGRWVDGDIMLGFNITRDFQIKGRKYN